MIVRPNGSTQLLITQPDHAALAARIMRHWCADGFPDAPRRAPILLAIEEHDNGWTEEQVDDAGSGYHIRLLGNRLTIEPDPFEGREVRLEIAARELPNRAFRSAADAHEAFSAAPIAVVTGIARGGSR